MSDGAMAAGFQFGSLISHWKFPIRGAVWLSGDRRILMHCGSGTIINAAAKLTWLTTPRRDGSWIVTTDQNDEGDPSGLKKIKRILNARFDTLLSAHLVRIEADRMAAAYPAGRPFDLLSSRARQINQENIRRGLARTRDNLGQYWSYTWMCSFASIGRFFKQFLGAIPQAWRTALAPVASTRLDVPAQEMVGKWRTGC
jgi:hypothetical protein